MNLSKKAKTIIGISAGVVILGSVGAVSGKNSADKSAPIEPEQSYTSSFSSASSYASSSEPASSSHVSSASSSSSATPAPVSSSSTASASSSSVIFSSASASSSSSKPQTSENSTFHEASNPASISGTTKYVLNTDSKIIHFSTCRVAKKMSEENRAETDDLEWAKANGYEACKICCPH